MDIGCYLVHAARFAFAQSLRASSPASTRSVMHTDRLTSAILEFPGGQSSSPVAPSWFLVSAFSSSVRSDASIEIPFNAPTDRPTRLFIDSGGDLSGGGITTETFPSATSTPTR